MKRLGRQSAVRKTAHEIEEEWHSHYRRMFHICARTVEFDDHLTEFALTVATKEELIGIVTGLSRIKDLPDHKPHVADALDELASLADGEIDVRRLRQKIYALVRREESFQPMTIDLVDRMDDVPAPPAPIILSEIADSFSLTPKQTRILIALYALEDVEPLSQIFRNASHRARIAILSDASEVDIPTFVEETAPGSPLEQLGLIGYGGTRDEVNDINLSRPLLFALRSNTLDDLWSGLFVDTPVPRFGLETFSLDSREIRTCMSVLWGGGSILVVGEPGIGKTEFVRSLIASIERNSATLVSANRRGREFLGPRGNNQSDSRLSAVRMAAHLLDPGEDVLVVDEADVILQSAVGMFGMLGGHGTYDKAELNELLESLPIPTVWISNGHTGIPASALRRFGHVLEFPRPAVDTRVRILTERLGSLAETNDWARDLAARYDITPAAIDRVEKIVRAEIDAAEITSKEVPDRVRGYVEMASSGVLARDVRKLPAASSSFDPRFCSTSESLDRVEQLSLRRSRSGTGIRLLFEGPPGGGKTQYALWLAGRLGRDVILRRPSDLLSMWVGGSEKNIAEAFRTAEMTGSVLVIDEADALLYDRGIARRSWEHSQIAEFLQQIQEFRGILVACTNRVDAVDPALRRRFHKHVTFGAIGEDVLGRALHHIFPGISFSDAELAALRGGPPLMMSDLATAAEMISMSDDGDGVPLGASEVAAEILLNAGARDKSREIGF